MRVFNSKNKSFLSLKNLLLECQVKIIAKNKVRKYGLILTCKTKQALYYGDAFLRKDEHFQINIFKRS